MIPAQESLARLTLRELRLKASELGVPLYSRKSKEILIKEICSYQERKENSMNHQKPFWQASNNSLEGSNDSVITTDTRVVFLPRDPQWAYVFWEISEEDRKRALSQRAYRLCLRLLDVTNVESDLANKGTLREITVDSHSTEWYLPIPMSDRDYRVELGYRTGLKWISLAISSSGRVPSMQPSEQILDQFVPFSLDSNSVDATAFESDASVSESLENGELHERLYQTATTHFRKTRVGSEEFQENDSQHSSSNDSGSGLWASGLNDSGVGGVNPRKRSFWLAADAELIVYGSTDPLAKLTIGGEEVPLSKDGTFRLQVPFRDGIQEYPIKASISDGEQTRNITMRFERVTPEDNTNPRDQKQSEWF